MSNNFEEQYDCNKCGDENAGEFECKECDEKFCSDCFMEEYGICDDCFKRTMLCRECNGQGCSWCNNTGLEPEDRQDDRQDE